MTEHCEIKRIAGCCGFGANRGSVFKRLPLVEVQDTYFSPLTKATLSRWKKKAPSSFVFSIRAWQVITHSPPYPRLSGELDADPSQLGLFRPTKAVLAAYEKIRRCAQVLDAEAIVFETPPEFTPTRQHRDRLATFFEKIERDDRLLVWQPRGVWTPAELKRIGADLSLLPALDPIVDDIQLEGTAYLRLHGQYTDDQLERIAGSVFDCERAFCLFNGLNMFRDAVRLQALLAGC